MTEKEIKRESRNIRYRVTVTKYWDNPIQSRTVDKEKTGKKSEYGYEDYTYKYGEWYDTFEEKSAEIFDQTVENLPISKLVAVINNLN